MGYDHEKYREKREKVLGAKKKRGLAFSTISTMVAMVIILGLGILVVPRAVDYMATRNLDDVIYKLETPDKWPNDILVHVSGINGVAETKVDKNNSRLVITFDRGVVDTDRFAAVFRNQRLVAIQLNRMNHRQRMVNLEEEENFEAL